MRDAEWGSEWALSTKRNAAAVESLFEAIVSVIIVIYVYVIYVVSNILMYI